MNKKETKKMMLPDEKKEKICALFQHEFYGPMYAEILAKKVFDIIKDDP